MNTQLPPTTEKIADSPLTPYDSPLISPLYQFQSPLIPIAIKAKGLQIYHFSQQKDSIFNSQISEQDAKIYQKIVNYDEACDETSQAKQLKTKHAILEGLEQIITIYGVKLNILYNDKKDNGVMLSGVKDNELLVNLLRRMLKIVANFPSKLIRKIQLIPFIVCQDLQCEQNQVKSEMKKAMKKNLIVIKQQEDKELKKMVFRAIFLAICRELPNFLNGWRAIDGEPSPTLPNEPIKPSSRDLDLFIEIVLSDFNKNDVAEEFKLKYDHLQEILKNYTEN